MKLVGPIAITDSSLVSTTVAEDDYPVWSSSTTYATGDRVIVLATHKIYESLVSSNTNKYPPDDISDPTPSWLEYSSTNAWKMFDNKVGSQTTSPVAITVEVVSSGASRLTLHNIYGLSVDVTMTDPVDGVVLNTTIDLLSTESVVDGLTYFFSPFSYKKNIIVNLPLYFTAILSVTVNPLLGENAGVGALIIGQETNIGCTQFGASVGITDYSVKQVDDFGDYSVLERAFSKRGSVTTLLANGAVGGVFNTLAKYRATPAVWIVTEDEGLASPFLIFGFYKDFSIVVQYATESVCNIEIEGLT